MEKFDVKGNIESIFDSYKKDLGDLVACYSKCADENAVEGAPFGPEARKALDTMVAICERFGLKTKVDPEGAYAWAEMGEGEEIFGILGHMDVVPCDDPENWATDPLKLTEIDGKLYGRGAIDDKGPALAALYSFKILIDNGAKLNKRVRFIFCTDEESLWRGVKRYVEIEEHPTMGITPDADFPLIYAENGLVEYELFGKEADFVDFQGGSAFNAVPAQASIPMDAKVKAAMDDLGYAYQEKDGRLVAQGKASHVCDAENGISAIVHLAQALVKAGNDSQVLHFIADVANDPFGEGVYGVVEDEQSGKMKFNIGTIESKPGEQKLGLDIRFPVSCTKETVDTVLAEVAGKYGIEVKEFDYLRSLYVPIDTPLVTTLMKAYQDITGDMETKPISTPGATYARSMDNIVAFGAVFPGREETEHQVNEYCIIEDMKKAMEIYIRMFELMTME